MNFFIADMTQPESEPQISASNVQRLPFNCSKIHSIGVHDYTFIYKTFISVTDAITS